MLLIIGNKFILGCWAALGGLLYINHQIELFLLLSVTSACLPAAYAIWLDDQQENQLKSSMKCAA